MEMKSLMTRVIFTSRRFLCGPWPLQPHFLIRRWIVQLASDKDHRTRGRHETGLVNAVAFLFFVDDRADIGDEKEEGHRINEPGFVPPSRTMEARNRAR